MSDCLQHLDSRSRRLNDHGAPDALVRGGSAPETAAIQISRKSVVSASADQGARRSMCGTLTSRSSLKISQ
jgi:hypothetical protein